MKSIELDNNLMNLYNFYLNKVFFYFKLTKDKKFVYKIYTRKNII